ncbi:alanine racemase [Leptospira yasudae]|uniref:Alanine racemase n=1 Tax=Leptospira yasudae TaxID=2202201 RepID=A0A6N4QVY8_9LEPT|nr:alanine racemase [Leptospira yasudae]TGL80508.1 alanine racemase [Leptospira yasudae]TGL80977.1 alanine racemase [Leptospira yasudae]TGL85935.1 alanine racemase [Leptospira yasudae]
MKLIRKKTILVGIAILVFLLIFAIKPGDNGKPYSPYFQNLNEELKTNGPGKPIVLLDLDRLDENLKVLKEKLKSPLQYRVVVKSLPSLDLLRYIVRATGSDRLMVFHSGDVAMLLSDGEFRKFNILLGKPMPIKAVADVYTKTDAKSFQNVLWLIDTEERLKEYLAFAQKENLRLSVSLEIDIGLHRGGFRKKEELDSSFTLIRQNKEHLRFSGFMGYEPHVASVPVIFGDKIRAIEDSLKKSLQVYSEFINYSKEKFPERFQGELVFNGGGSKTYRFYQEFGNGIVNDVSVGSALVKPTDFDTVSLEEHSPAVFIAAPILKRLEGTNIPFLESISFLFSFWDPNQQLTYFTYGGAFSAKKESPSGLQDNSLYGASTNQGILNGSLKTSLFPNDFVFYRPTQSEKVMAELGEIHLIRKGKLSGKWKTFVN